MRDWIALARPRQWTKNLLLYAPFLFTAGDAWGIGDDGEVASLAARVTLGVVAFCLLSSAGYLLNDARDATVDRLHPKKRLRPIAAGRIDARIAQRVAPAIAFIGLAMASVLGVTFLLTAVVYLLGTVFYSRALRHLPVIDALTVAAFFVLRVLAGAAAIDEPASPWIIACTFAGALFVASVKRQQDYWLLGSDAHEHRRSARRGALSDAKTVHWPTVLAVGAGVATAGLYAWYAAFAENVPPTGTMLMSWPFVPIALVRYWYVAKARPERDADEIAFRDPWVLVTVLGFLVVAVGTLLAE